MGVDAVLGCYAQAAYSAVSHVVMAMRRDVVCRSLWRLALRALCSLPLRHLSAKPLAERSAVILRCWRWS